MSISTSVLKASLKFNNAPGNKVVVTLKLIKSVDNLNNAIQKGLETDWRARQGCHKGHYRRSV